MTFRHRIFLSYFSRGNNYWSVWRELPGTFLGHIARKYYDSFAAKK